MESKSPKKNARKKEKGKKAKRDRLEFFVSDIQDLAIVKKSKDKIQRMYEIQIHFDNKTEGGQWIALFGEPVDRRNAKNYIVAICNPSEKRIVQFPHDSIKEVTNAEAIEDIEKKTNAFIRPLDKIAQFEVSGTELAVTLALSEIEERAGKVVEERNSNKLSVEMSDVNVLNISPGINHSKSRLSDQLQRALSENSDGVCNAGDYMTASASVQRVLVNCLQNDEGEDVDEVDDEDLFAEGDEDDQTHNEEESKGCNKSSFNQINNQTNDMQQLKGITEKLEKASVSSSPPSDDNQTSVMSKELEFLKAYGLGLGYSGVVVEKTLQMADEKTRPSDFLALLKVVKTGHEYYQNESSESSALETSGDDVIIESETVEYLNTTNSPDKEMVTDSASGNSNLPDIYLQKFHADDNVTDIAELKRQNIERQKFLQQRFNANHDSGQAKIAERSSQNDGFGNIGTGQKQQDTDETCVMRFWDDEEERSDEAQLDEFTSQRQSRAQQYSDRPQYAKVAKQGYTPGGKGPGKHWSPQRGKPHYQKPTQVVTPVSVQSPGGTSRPQEPLTAPKLRYIVIDGSNVAMTHGNGRTFSCRGIKICVDFFKQRGHKDITAFVPNWRNCKPGPTNQILDQHILQDLKAEGVLVFTPSRVIGKKMVASYDDRFIVTLAENEEGIIVSNDQYRDLMTEKASWKQIIETRLLMFSFVKDLFMPPNDPLGRDGPRLDQFLTHTYMSNAHSQPYQPRSQNYNQAGQGNTPGRPYQNREANSAQDSGSSGSEEFRTPRKSEFRTEKQTEQMFRDLKVIFPDKNQEEVIRKVLYNHGRERNLERLANYCMSVLTEQ